MVVIAQNAGVPSCWSVFVSVVSQSSNRADHVAFGLSAHAL